MTHAVELMTETELTRMPRRDDAGFGALATERGNLPLTAMDVRARVVGLVAEIELRQTFVNSVDERIEATYVFPLPDRAAVHRFRMTVGDRIVDGVVRERGEARREYQEAIEAGHRAAITEEERPGVFTLRVGNLMPGDVATIELSLTGPLPIEEGDATFRFPLVVAPRYIPGNPLPGDSVGDGVAADTDAVPDASRITPPVLLPGCPNPVKLSLRLDVDPAGLPLSKLRSSLHAVAASDAGGGRQRIELAAGERLDRDFIVRFQLGDDAVRSSLRLVPDDGGSGGTFALTLLPPAVDPSRAARPRDAVFVLDRSGSMGGWKMVAARRAVARMIDTLGDSDRFAVYAFDNAVETPPAFGGIDLVPATDRNRFRAIEFLARIDARGGTEMAQPLAQAVDRLGGGYQERDRVLVLVTDGQVGNEDQILREIVPRLRNTRVFTLGIDRAVNAAFLGRLAAAGGGSSALVETEDRLDEVMDKIHRRIATPVVTELALEARGLDIDRDSCAPSRLPDLFEAAPLTITGRFRGEARGGVLLRGQDALGSPWEQPLAGTIDRDGRAAVIWARAHLRDLEDRYAIGGADPELAKRIVDISCRFQVLCRFTAFLAIDRSDKVDPSGRLHRVIQPVEEPEGWNMGRASMSTQSGIMRSGYAPAAVMKAAAMPVAAVPMGAPQAPGPGFPPAPKSPAPVRAKLEAAARMVGRLLHRAEDKDRLDMSMGMDVGDAGEAHDMDMPMEMEMETIERPAPFDLAGYVVRIQRAVERARKERVTIAALRRLAAELAPIADDLESVGGPAAQVAALRALVAELRQRAASAAPEPELTAYLAEAARRAVELAQGAPGVAPVPPRREFWK